MLRGELRTARSAPAPRGHQPPAAAASQYPPIAATRRRAARVSQAWGSSLLPTPGLAEPARVYARLLMSRPLSSGLPRPSRNTSFSGLCCGFRLFASLGSSAGEAKGRPRRSLGGRPHAVDTATAACTGIAFWVVVLRGQVSYGQLGVATAGRAEVLEVVHDLHSAPRSS